MTCSCKIAQWFLKEKIVLLLKNCFSSFGFFFTSRVGYEGEKEDCIFKLSFRYESENC